MTSINIPFFDGSKVKQLTLDRINEKGDLISPVADRTVVMFYADWCGACKSTKPGYVKFANSAPKGIDVKALDYASAYKLYIDQWKYKITGYPTIIGFYKGKAYSIYNGDRTAEDLLEYAKHIGTKPGY